MGIEREKASYAKLRKQIFIKERKDLWVWKEDEKLEYTVISAYRLLRNDIDREYRPLFEQFWTTNVLPSTHIVAWRVLIDRLLMRVNLKGREMSLESKLCVMCKIEEKTNLNAKFLG